MSIPSRRGQARRTSASLPVPRLSPLAFAIFTACIVSTPLQAQQLDADASPIDAPAAALATSKTFPSIEVTTTLPERASSPKLTAPLLDTPQTISVVPSEVFNAQGAQNLTDVLRNTPGISFNAGENGFATNTNNFSLRGFDTSGSIFIDGVRDPGNYSRDVFNLERVEVAKGPAADNGRGGAGGYINLVTKTPHRDYSIAGTASFGTDEYDSHNRARTTLDINQPLSEGSALRLNLLAQDGGVAGRAFAQQDAFGIAPSLAFGLGTETRLHLSAQHVAQSGRPEWGVPGALIEGMLRYDVDAARAERDNFYGLSSDFDDNTSSTLMGRIEHDFSPSLGLSNQTRWSKTARDAVYTLPTGYDPDTQLVSTQSQAYGRETSSLSNLTNLNAWFQTGALEHTLAAGLEFSREESDGERFVAMDAPDTSVLDPIGGRAPTWRPEPAQNSRVQIDTAALYVYDTVEFNEQWQVTGGLRGEHYEVDIASHDLTTGAPQGPDGYRVTETTLGGKLGVVYKPAENGSIYAAVGISTLPPGSYLSNPDISRTGNNAFPGLVGQNNQAAKPQRSVNHEIGTKWNFFDDKFSTTLAVFQTQRRSVAISGKQPGEPDSPTLLRGYGKQVVRGVELGLSGRITDAWLVYGGAVFLDSERQHSAFLDAARREASPNDYGDYLTTDGDELAFTPKQSANLWTTYTLASGLTLGGGVQHVGDGWVGRPDDADRIIPNGKSGKLPGYTVGNLMASYAVNPQLTLRLNIDNVTDELYAVSSNWPAQRVALGMPRSYLLSADFRF